MYCGSTVEAAFVVDTLQIIAVGHDDVVRLVHRDDRVPSLTCQLLATWHTGRVTDLVAVPV